MRNSQLFVLPLFGMYQAIHGPALYEKINIRIRIQLAENPNQLHQHKKQTYHNVTSLGRVQLNYHQRFHKNIGQSCHQCRLEMVACPTLHCACPCDIFYQNMIYTWVYIFLW